MVYGVPELHRLVFQYKKTYFKSLKLQLDIKFLNNCKDNNVYPKFVRWRNLKSKRHKLRATFHKRILNDAIREQHVKLRNLKAELPLFKERLMAHGNWLKMTCIRYSAESFANRDLIPIKDRHQRKFNNLLKEYDTLLGCQENPNAVITNLSGETLTPPQQAILKYGLKYSLATRPKESDMIVFAENIFEQLQYKNLLPDAYMKREKIKNSLRSLACNFLDFDSKRLKTDSKHILELKNLKAKFAILKPDKGNGIVLMTWTQYYGLLTDIFSDTTKFRKLTTDPTLTQLTTLQNYLRTLKNRGELSDTEYDSAKPSATMPARAHGLPKIHKDFDILPSIRPIIDTTGTAYYNLGRFLAKLLYPLTVNQYTVKDTFDAVHRIQNIPKHLFDEGYRFVSFDVESLFTNVPLSKTINVILNRIFKDKTIVTTLKKTTLKKLLSDACTKTPFMCNGSLYQQIDGVSMGSSLGPVLANIIMTQLEKEIVDKLVADNLIKFYIRFVDDTLVLAKPEHFQCIQDKLNSFNSQLKFTSEMFVDHVHFLDISITPNSTTVYRKETHTGQYVHYSSFEPRFTKLSWVRSLIYRAHRICSNEQLLKIELNKIKDFLSWNGYPRFLANRLIKQFTPKYGPSNCPSDQDIPKIFVSLPYIGEQGENLAKRFVAKLRHLINKPVKIQTHWQTTKLSFFTNTKDPIPKQYQSSVVYKFTCPGCSAPYIGKTDRNLITRIKEHAKPKSEIFSHVEHCPNFNHLHDILNLPHTLLNHNPVNLYETIFDSVKIIDKSSHWSLLLYKEALAIRQQNPKLNHGLKASKDFKVFR